MLRPNAPSFCLAVSCWRFIQVFIAYICHVQTSIQTIRLRDSFLNQDRYVIRSASQNPPKDESAHPNYVWFPKSRSIYNTSNRIGFQRIYTRTSFFYDIKKDQMTPLLAYSDIEWLVGWTVNNKKKGANIKFQFFIAQHSDFGKEYIEDLNIYNIFLWNEGNILPRYISF